MSSSNFPVKFNDVDSLYEERQCSPTNVGKESTNTISNPLLESFMIQSQCDLDKFDFDYDNQLKIAEKCKEKSLSSELKNESEEDVTDLKEVLPKLLSKERNLSTTKSHDSRSSLRTTQVSENQTTVSSNNTVFNVETVDSENNKENTSPENKGGEETKSENETKLSTQTSPVPQAQSFTVNFDFDKKEKTVLPPRLQKAAKLYEQKREEKLAANLAKTQEEAAKKKALTQKRLFNPPPRLTNPSLRQKPAVSSTTSTSNYSRMSHPVTKKAPFRAGVTTPATTTTTTTKLTSNNRPTVTSRNPKSSTMPRKDSAPNQSEGRPTSHYMKAPATTRTFASKVSLDKTNIARQPVTSTSSITRPTAASSNRRLTNPTFNRNSTKFPKPKQGGEPIKSTVLSSQKPTTGTKPNLKQSLEPVSLKQVDLFYEKFSKYESIKDYLMDKMFEHLENPDSMFEVLEQICHEECPAEISEAVKPPLSPEKPKKFEVKLRPKPSEEAQNLRFDELPELSMMNLKQSYIIDKGPTRSSVPIELSASMHSLAMSHTGTYNLDKDNTLAAKGHPPIVVDPKKSFDCLTQLSELKEAKKKFCDSRNHSGTNVRQSITALSQILHNKTSPLNRSVNDSLKTNLPSTVTEIALTPGVNQPGSMFNIDSINKSSINPNDSVFRSFDLNEITLRNNENPVTNSTDITSECFKQLPRLFNNLKRSQEKDLDQELKEAEKPMENDTEKKEFDGQRGGDYVDLKYGPKVTCNSSDVHRKFSHKEQLMEPDNYYKSEDGKKEYESRRNFELRLPTSWLNEEYASQNTDAKSSQQQNHGNMPTEGEDKMFKSFHDYPSKSKSDDEDDLLSDYPGHRQIQTHEQISAHLFLSQISTNSPHNPPVNNGHQHPLNPNKKMTNGRANSANVNNTPLTSTPSSSSSGQKKSLGSSNGAQANKTTSSSNRPNSLVGSAFSIPNYSENNAQRNITSQYQSKTPLESPRRFNYPAHLMKRKLSTSSINEQNSFRSPKNEGSLPGSNAATKMQQPSRIGKIVSTTGDQDTLTALMTSSGSADEDPHISLSQLATEINRVNRNLIQRIERSRQNSLYDIFMDSDLPSSRSTARGRNKSGDDYSNRTTSSLSRSETHSSTNPNELKEILRLMQTAAYNLNSASKLLQSQENTPPSSIEQQPQQSADTSSRNYPPV